MCNGYETFNFIVPDVDEFPFNEKYMKPFQNQNIPISKLSSKCDRVFRVASDPFNSM